LHTQDEERRHIARELHDSAGQTLAVLGMNLSALADTAKQKAPEIAQSAEEIQEMVQQLTKEIRTTSYLLHPPLLDQNGLPPALSWYIRGLTERSGLDIAFTISDDFGRLPAGHGVGSVPSGTGMPDQYSSSFGQQDCCHTRGAGSRQNHCGSAGPG
jgi:signal transduction histidine kinase